MHRFNMHMKSIKLYPAATTDYERLSENSNIKGQSFSWKVFFMKLLIILCLAVVSVITIMAYFTSEVLFEYLLTGLFIVGCLLFIKGTQNEETDVRGTQRKIHK